MRRHFSPANLKTWPGGIIDLTAEARARFVTSQGGIPGFLQAVFGYNESNPYHALRKMSGGKATGFYREREAYMEDMRDVLYPYDPTVPEQLAMRERIDSFAKSLEEKVRKPFYYDYYLGWKALTENLPVLFFLIAFFAGICIAPMFAGEYQTSMDSVLLCCKYGRSKLAGAKVRASLLFSGLLYVLCTAVYTMLNLAAFGYQGWDCPIQFSRLYSPAPLNYLQLFGLSCAAGLSGCLAITGMVLLFSSVMRSAFQVVVVTMGVLLISIFVPKTLEDYFIFLPASAFRMEKELYHTDIIGGIWKPVVIAILPVIGLAITGPVSSRLFSRHEVR